MDEAWKEVPGFAGQYLVSSNGAIRSREQLVRHCPKGVWLERIIPERLMKTTATKLGYRSVELRQGGKRRRMLVHRVVALAFIENPKGLPHVNHIDADKANNGASNLEWVTHAQNMAHAASLSLMISNSGPGMESPAAKLTDQCVIAIKQRLAAGEGPASIARDYPVTRSAIGEIKAGRSWSHITIPEDARNG